MWDDSLVADTGDFEQIGKFQPQDATTNPSLLYKAALMPQYVPLVDSAVAASADIPEKDRLGFIIDRLSVNFGLEILKLVPGYVSTEVDARLSFDTAETIARAHRIIDMYAEAGIGKDRILVKIAATWEGIQACRVLEQEGIHCNLTLLFGFSQAVACAEAHATLISPFVGRILDWYKAKGNVYEDPATDPGVISVSAIYNYYKKFGHATIVMGASFRNTGQVLALAGCDRLTISPALLSQLEESVVTVDRSLDAATSASIYKGPQVSMDEKAFRLAMNDNAMATEKLAEGIRGFSADIEKLEVILREKLAAK